MSSKYLSAGTCSWTASTRVISGATMSPVFDSTDGTHQVFFRSGANIYWGRIDSFLTTTSVSLLQMGTLPGSDVTLAEIIVPDLGEVHTYLDYVNKIKALIKDDSNKLSDADFDRFIALALSDYDNDLPFNVGKKITGNGTGDYIVPTTFGSLWTQDISYILSIEYPFGSTPQEMLEKDDYGIYDDGTAQNGSNLKLRFKDVKPTASQSFVAIFRAQRSLPVSGTQNFPDTNIGFAAIVYRSAMCACLGLATQFAQTQDMSISADVVNYGGKSDKYRKLAGEFKALYNRLVFGTEEPKDAMLAATTDVNQDLELAFVRSGRLFHRD